MDSLSLFLLVLHARGWGLFSSHKEIITVIEEVLGKVGMKKQERRKKDGLRKQNSFTFDCILKVKAKV